MYKSTDVEAGHSGQRSQSVRVHTLLIVNGLSLPRAVFREDGGLLGGIVRAQFALT